MANILSKSKDILLWTVFILPYVFLGVGYFYYHNLIEEIPESKILIVDKEQLLMTVINYKGTVLYSFPISVGKNFGQKQDRGDLRTPQGLFKIVSVEDSRDWSYDFEDDSLPAIKGAYGPYFFRLGTDFQGIGIHGTNNPFSVGLRVTHGCIRLRNTDLVKLKKLVGPRTSVVITPARNDLFDSSNCSESIK
jgi:lipoprotein-anchoring transpeptidase ErfK/SrfK